MPYPKVRISIPSIGRTITSDPAKQVNATTSFPAKEWCVQDDVLNISDSASVTIANDDGEIDRSIFQMGARIELYESDAGVTDVSAGQWVPMFTGRITGVESYSDIHGGSNIQISAMDLGWHLTMCHGKPLVNLNHIKFSRLLDILIDPTWEFGPTDTTHGNSLNRTLKQGRIGVQRVFNPQSGALLPFIQIEPGQTPFDILRTYAAREGVLINVGVKGNLILFRPDYSQPASYAVEYHPVKSATALRNNVVGRPSLRESIDGLYSEVQCWSTVVIPIAASGNITDNPNQSFRHFVYRPSINPLPFERRQVFSDSEAINPDMRKNRAIWKEQMDRFNSWEYTVEFPSHSQNGHFFVSDTMISVSDSMHRIAGTYYVQRVQRSQTLSGGTRAKLTIRKPGLLDPTLTAQLGGGAKAAAS